jgi:hypothetical protein
MEVFRTNPGKDVSEKINKIRNLYNSIINSHKAIAAEINTYKFKINESMFLIKEKSDLKDQTVKKYFFSLK